MPTKITPYAEQEMIKYFDTAYKSYQEIILTIKPKPRSEIIAILQAAEVATQKPPAIRTPTAMPDDVHPRLSGSPMAYGYGRVSDHESYYDRQLSVPAQEQRITNYFTYHLENKGVKWGGFYDDGKNISGRKYPFSMRPAGKTIISMLRRGDHVIFDRLDRLCRSTKDFLNLKDWFKQNNIGLHILNANGISINTDSPMGEMFMTIMAAAAQLDADNISMRMRDSFNYRRKNRGYLTQDPPIGIDYNSTTGEASWNMEERLISGAMYLMFYKANIKALACYESFLLWSKTIPGYTPPPKLVVHKWQQNKARDIIKTETFYHKIGMSIDEPPYAMFSKQQVCHIVGVEMRNQSHAIMHYPLPWEE